MVATHRCSSSISGAAVRLMLSENAARKRSSHCRVLQNIFSHGKHLSLCSRRKTVDYEHAVLPIVLSILILTHEGEQVVPERSYMRMVCLHGPLPSHEHLQLTANTVSDLLYTRCWPQPVGNSPCRRTTLMLLSSNIISDLGLPSDVICKSPWRYCCQTQSRWKGRCLKMFRRKPRSIHIQNVSRSTMS